MKILVIGKPTEALQALQPDVALKLMEATLRGANQLREEGKIIEAYTTPRGYSVVIMDYKSADEWVKDQKYVPGIKFYEWEQYPLADAIEAMNDTIETLRAMKG